MKLIKMNRNDILNGLRHTADDHPCCESIIEAAITFIEKVDYKPTHELKDSIDAYEETIEHWAEVARGQKADIARLEAELRDAVDGYEETLEHWAEVARDQKAIIARLEAELAELKEERN